MTVTVRELMTEHVRTVGPDDDLVVLMDLMDKRHIRHVPVVDDDGALLGLISHRDVMRKALGGVDDLPLSHQRDVLRAMTASEIMVGGVETAEPDQDLREVAETMLENKFGCVPVVEGDVLVGILTEADFVRYAVELLDAAEG